MALTAVRTLEIALGLVNGLVSGLFSRVEQLNERGDKAKEVGLELSPGHSGDVLGIDQRLEFPHAPRHPNVELGKRLTYRLGPQGHALLFGEKLVVQRHLGVLHLCESRRKVHQGREEGTPRRRGNVGTVDQVQELLARLRHADAQVDEALGDVADGEREVGAGEGRGVQRLLDGLHPGQGGVERLPFGLQGVGALNLKLGVAGDNEAQGADKFRGISRGAGRVLPESLPCCDCALRKGALVDQVVEHRLDRCLATTIVQRVVAVGESGFRREETLSASRTVDPQAHPVTAPDHRGDRAADTREACEAAD